MKRTQLIIIAAFFVLCAACKKNYQPKYTGISAKKGNAQWKAEAVRSFTGYKQTGTKDTLIIVGRNGEENIIIVLAQKGKGTYTGSQIRAYFYQTLGFDAVVASYRLTNSQQNFVTITDYDEAGRILKGSFNFLFKRVQGYDILTDTLQFTNGKIDMELTDQFVKVFTGFPPNAE